MIDQKLEQTRRISDSTDLDQTQVFFCLLSSSVAQLDLRLIEYYIAALIKSKCTVVAIKEVILQNYLFCGFPNAIEALIILRSSLKAEGIADDNFEDKRTRGQVREAGLKLCEQVYGGNFEKLSANMSGMSKDLYNWMIQEGYGKVLSRPVMSAEERELCIVSSLSTLGRKRQLISHLVGSHNIGLRQETIFGAIKILQALIPKVCYQLAVNAFHEVFSEKQRHS